MLIRTSKDKDHPYVMLNKNFLEDPRLSLKAKGLLAYCMCKPDGWQFHVDQMITVLKEKKFSIYAAFKELITLGYCIRNEIRQKDGKISKYDYTLFEVPYNQQPNVENQPQPNFQQAGNPRAGKQPLVINDNKVINDSKDISASFVGTSSSKKSKKKKEKTPTVIRMAHEIPELSIETSDEDHAKLVEKFGQVFTNQCYESLQNWKISKHECGESIADHTDYYRIIKWVASNLKKQELTPKKDAQTELQKKMIQNFKHGDIYNGAECFIDSEGIAFSRGMTHMQVKFKEFGFKDQFENMLRKFGIQSNKDKK